MMRDESRSIQNFIISITEAISFELWSCSHSLILKNNFDIKAKIISALSFPTPKKKLYDEG